MSGVARQGEPRRTFVGVGPRNVRRRPATSQFRDRLRERPGVSTSPSQADVLWLHADGMPGAELAGRMERAGVLVAGEVRSATPVACVPRCPIAPATPRTS